MLVCVVMAAIGMLVAAGAQASEQVDYDSVSLGSGSFKFRSGDVYWWYGDARYSAHLTGDLTINNANGSCARMRMEYFDNSESLTVQYGGTVCADDGRSHTWTVDLDPYADARIDLVKISLEKQTAAGWSTVESGYYKPNIAPDKVRLSADGVDLGDDWFVGSATTGSATLDWGQGDGALLTPHLQGYLHLNNIAGVCARVKLVYMTESYSTLATRYGGAVCAPDNGHHYWSVDLAPYSSTLIGAVQVSMQTQGTNGSWNDITSAGSGYTYELWW
jgi:hypothetical protein